MCTNSLCDSVPVKAQHGISLVELIIFIVIISVAVVGILGVMTLVTRYSADPLLHKQALAAAESLLEEIELQDFNMPSGVLATSGVVNSSNRAAGYHIVSDYNGFKTTGIFPVNGATVIAGLGSYNASVTVQSPLAANWNGIPAASAALITVTVTDPQGTAITLDGYRTAY